MKKFVPSSKEYTKDMLPQTRKAVFFDVIKINFWKLVYLGVITLAFALLMLAWALVGDLYTGNLNNLLQQSSPQDRESIALHISQADNFFGLVNIVFWMFFSVGFAGLQRVIRQYAWGQNVSIGDDFAKGIKQNVSSSLLLALVVGGGLLLSKMGYNTASQLDGGWAFVAMLAVGVFVFFIVPTSAIASVCIPIYGNKFTNTLKMAFAVYIKDFLKIWLALICCGVWLVPLLIPNLYVRLVGRVVLCLLCPFLMLAFNLFVYNLLDKTVNVALHPELIGKGVYSLSEK